MAGTPGRSSGPGGAAPWPLSRTEPAAVGKGGAHRGSGAGGAAPWRPQRTEAAGGGEGGGANRVPSTIASLASMTRKKNFLGGWCVRVGGGGGARALDGAGARPQTLRGSVWRGYWRQQSKVAALAATTAETAGVAASVWGRTIARAV